MSAVDVGSVKYCIKSLDYYWVLCTFSDTAVLDRYHGLNVIVILQTKYVLLTSALYTLLLFLYFL